MEIQSRRRITIRGVVADSVTGDYLLPDSSVITINAVIIGATHFARVGKYESLDWPPQTIFVEFNQEFLRNELPLGYARRIRFNGVLHKAHWLRSPRDRDFAVNLKYQQRKTLAHHFKHWLAHEQHTKIKAWPQIQNRLLKAVADYLDAKFSLDRLLSRFSQAFASFGPRQSARVAIMVKNAWALSAKFDRSLDERLPPVWLFTAVQQVENFQYGDERQNLIKAELNHFEKRNEPGYLQHMFDQVQVQKQQFQTLGLPFYDPQWLATMRERGRPVWDPDQLNQYL